MSAKERFRFGVRQDLLGAVMETIDVDGIFQTSFTSGFQEFADSSWYKNLTLRDQESTSKQWRELNALLAVIRKGAMLTGRTLKNNETDLWERICTRMVLYLEILFLFIRAFT